MENKQTEPIEIKANSHAELSLSIYAEEDPFAIRIVKSGWTDPNMFHVIFEFGDMDSSDYKGIMDADQIKSKFGVDVECINVKDLSLQSIDIPNDMEFGKSIRTQVFKSNQNSKL